MKHARAHTQQPSPSLSLSLCSPSADQHPPPVSRTEQNRDRHGTDRQTVSPKDPQPPDSQVPVADRIQCGFPATGLDLKRGREHRLISSGCYSSSRSGSGSDGYIGAGFIEPECESPCRYLVWRQSSLPPVLFYLVDACLSGDFFLLGKSQFEVI